MDDQQHEALETQLGDGDIEPKLEDHQGPLTQDEPLLNLDFTESTLKTSRAELECPSITSSATCQISFNQAQTLSAWDRFRSWANSCWFFEISACLLHVIALGIIVVVLFRYQNDALPQWPGYITINSLISVLSTIMKGCMLYLVSEGISQLKWTWFSRPRQLSTLASFDSASRGPWGSFMFLTSRTPDALALLGASITIVALAVDPFAQQIVAYHPCLITDPVLKPTLSRVSWYDPFLDLGGPQGSDGGRLGYQSDPALTRAMYSVMSDPSLTSIHAPNFSCPTGNCTFTRPGGYYTTLSISHNCSDISSQIQDNSVPDTIRPYGWNYSLPLGTTQSPYIDYEHLLSMQSLVNQTTTSPMFLSNRSTWFSFTSLMFRTPRGSEDGFEPFAVTCHAWPSIKTYNAVVTSGKLEEFEIASEDLEYVADKVYVDAGTYPSVKPKALKDGVWRSCDEASVGSSLNTTQEYETELASGCAFFLGESMVATTKAWIDPLLSRSVFGFPTYVKSGLGAQVEGGSATDKNPTAMHLSAVLLEGSATVATVDAWVGAIAQAITTYIRSNADTSITGNEPTIGEAQVYRTCMSVRWPWLILPAFLSVMTMIFLVAIVLYPNHSAAEPHRAGLWKSSILALLLHESSDVEFQQYSGPIDPVSLQCRADHVITTLQRRPLLQTPITEDDV